MGMPKLYSEDYFDDLEDEVKKLKGHITLLRLVMVSCEEKLEIYRDHSNGQYHGGAEHTSLIGRIKISMAVTKPEDEDGS